MWKTAAKELSGKLKGFLEESEEKESTSRLSAGIEGKDGKLLTDIVEVKESWTDHFSALLEGDGRGSKARVSFTPHGY